MKIVIASNAFKGSLSAKDACEAIERGFNESLLMPETESFPIADGGDGTLDVWSEYFNGELIKVETQDALGRPMVAEIAELPQKKFLIEMAEASGIKHLKKEELDVTRASSFGTGQLIKAALENGAVEIILGLGGSATVDAGLGMLQALGVILSDAEGQPLGNTANPLMQVTDLDFASLDKRFKKVKFTLLCDVDNPLLGPNGAAAVFAPQKGASATMVKKLEARFESLNQLLKARIGKDYGHAAHGGAAGGISYILMAMGKAAVVQGVDYLLHLIGFRKSLEGASFLITGEGSLDGQTLGGKGPSGVAKLAADCGVPTIALAGKIENEVALNKLFAAVFPISNGAADLRFLMKNTSADLERTSRQIGNLLYASKSNFWEAG
ncbi:MAG: glycerate kinase [Cyclobacteriaceae bacterium]|nr:glycerate kinase [Cyclobacteriaceae bacterium]